MAEKLFTYRMESGQGAEQMAQELNAALYNLGEITIHDVAVSNWQLNGGKQQISVTITYRDNGTRWGVAGATSESNNPESCAGGLNAIFRCRPQYVARFLRSVSNFSAGKSQAALLCFYELTRDGDTAQGLWPFWYTFALLRATGNIAAGATDSNAELVNVDADTVTTVSAVNRGGVQWDNGRIALAFRDERTGTWFAYPGCC